MLVDETYITVRAGHGGAGRVSFFPGLKSGPDGGPGGRGGSVYVTAVENMTDLHQFSQKRLFVAGNGESGGAFRRDGKDALDLELFAPVGTVFIDQASRESFELEQAGQRLLLCKGGRGGRGNDSFKSSTERSPRKAEPGQPGEEKHFQLVMKLIADYGLIGLPNAGKSSLLNELTSAKVRTADYPFTTLEPNLGSFNGKIIADIPGLIEGASKGKGLGIKFLKHIEKVRLLIHCIAGDSTDIARDYKTVTNELKKYNAALAEKKEIILLTKHDLLTPEDTESKKKILEKYGKEILVISIHDWDSLEQLKKYL